MPQKHEFVQLEANEDVASVRDRLTVLRGQHVLLIWPEKGTALTRKLDLVLVQREAMRLAIRLAIVTHDEQVIKHARELNISTFETIGASDRGKWKRGRSNVFTDRFDKPEEEPEPDDLMPVASRVRIPVKRTPLRVIGRIVVLALLIGVTAAVALLLIPSATITITPAQEQLQAEATIEAEVDPSVTQIDVEKGTMPAIIARAQIEQQSSIPTSGTQTLTNTRSTGTVIFINKTNGAVKIPAGTQVSTSASTPVTFQTTQDATVTAGIGLQIEVPIQAADGASGTLGNIGANLINVIIDPALAGEVEVRNVNPTVGGQNRSVNVVTQTDHDRLIDILRQQIQDQAYTEMLPRLEQTQFIIPETIHIAEERSDWMTFNHQVGDVADSLSLDMRAVVEATVVDQTLAQQIAFARLQVPANHVIQPNTVTYQRGAVSNVGQDGSVTFTMVCSGQVVAAVDVGNLQQNLAGRTLGDAAGYLVSEVDLAQNSSAEISISPNWLDRLPLLPMRITIHTESPS